MKCIDDYIFIGKRYWYSRSACYGNIVQCGQRHRSVFGGLGPLKLIRGNLNGENFPASEGPFLYTTTLDLDLYFPS